MIALLLKPWIYFQRQFLISVPVWGDDPGIQGEVQMLKMAADDAFGLYRPPPD